MPEIEIHTSHGEHENNPLVLPVSLTISILAVLVAAATLMGHRAHTEEVILQAKSSDQWAYSQADAVCALTWVRGDEMVPLAAEWRGLISP